MIKIIKHLTIMCMDLALATNVEGSYSKNHQNFYEREKTDIKNDEFQHIAQKENNICYSTRDPCKNQAINSDSRNNNVLSYDNNDEFSINQSYMELCSNYTYVDLSNNPIHLESQTPLQYNYNYNNLTNFDSFASSNLSSGLNYDGIQCLNEPNIGSIIPSQSPKYSNSSEINEKATVSGHDFNVNSTAVCPSQCIENGGHCLCYLVDKFLPPETKCTEKFTRETQNSPQGLNNAPKNYTFEKSGPVKNKSNLHINISNISPISQTENFVKKSSVKKRKLSEYKNHRNQNTKLFYNPVPVSRKADIRQRLGKIKPIKGVEVKNGILITNVVKNLYYYRSVVKGLEEDKNETNSLINFNQLKFLRKNQIILQNLNIKSMEIFDDESFLITEQTLNLKERLSPLLLAKRDQTKMLHKIDHDLLDNQNFLIDDFRKKKLIQSLFKSKNKELRKKNLPVMKEISLDFFKNYDNFIEKKIVLLKPANNICRLNIEEDISLISCSSFNCDNECLIFIIADIYLFYCQNRFSGDEGCIIKSDLYEKIQELVELPKFLDLVFLADYNAKTNIIDDIIVVLNSFRLASKVLYDPNFKLDKARYIHEFRLHILQYLRLLCGKSMTFALYSHVMAYYERYVKHGLIKTYHTAILYFSFFVITIDYKKFTSLNFFYSEDFNYFIVLHRTRIQIELLQYLIYLSEVRKIFMYNFNNYIIKCLCNCGRKANDYKKSYYISVKSKSVVFLEPCKEKIDYYFYENGTYSMFIHKLINCYFKAIKRIF